MCYVAGEFPISNTDVDLGGFDGTPFHMGVEQFKYGKHALFTVDECAMLEKQGQT